jgi:hypothetical protein
MEYKTMKTLMTIGLAAAFAATAGYAMAAGVSVGGTANSATNAAASLSSSPGSIDASAGLNSSGAASLGTSTGNGATIGLNGNSDLSARAGAGGSTSLGNSSNSGRLSTGLGVDSGPSVTSQGALGGSSTDGSLLGNIQSGAGANADLSNVTDASDVNIVLLSKLDGTDSVKAKALQESIASNASTEAKLQTSISGNAAIMAALKSYHYAPNQVVAVKTSADGTATIYVNDQA